MMDSSKTGFLFSVLMVGLIACSDDRLSSADPSNLEHVALGKTVYDQHCASCHGNDLQGQDNWRKRGPDGKLPAPPHDDSGHTWHHPDKVLFEIVKKGMVPPYAPENYQTNMQGWGDQLTDEQIWAVLAFIKSRWSDESRRVQRGIDENARRQE